MEGSGSGVFMQEILSILMEGGPWEHQCPSAPNLLAMMTEHTPTATGAPEAELHVLGMRSVGVQA